MISLQEWRDALFIQAAVRSISTALLIQTKLICLHFCHLNCRSVIVNSNYCYSPYLSANVESNSDPSVYKKCPNCEKLISSFCGTCNIDYSANNNIAATPILMINYKKILGVCS